MTKKTSTELDLIKEIAAILKDENLSEIEIEKDGVRIKVQYGNVTNETTQVEQKPSQPVVPKQSLEKELTDISNDTKYIKSPMVGTCYLSPEPGSKPFISVGTKINKGDPIIIIEAMKTFNTIPSTESGVVTEILVSDGQPIEFGENIIAIE
tara:strand:+ start:7112 stop:7567 length:456 start_codon:yes stop_codon:yes gene_type:complete